MSIKRVVVIVLSLVILMTICNCQNQSPTSYFDQNENADTGYEPDDKEDMETRFDPEYAIEIEIQKEANDYVYSHYRSDTVKSVSSVITTLTNLNDVYTVFGRIFITDVYNDISTRTFEAEYTLTGEIFEKNSFYTWTERD